MHALICGSMAYDTIMVFPDKFKNHILPEQVHILNVAFLVPEMRRQFGGCAGNISYNLHLLGGKPLPMATVGQDFAAYRDHFTALGIALKYVRQLDDEFTAQAFITTDMDDNQITAFHPGAMTHSTLNRVADVTEEVQIGIVGPDSRAGMLAHSEGFVARGIPHIFDPGQALPLFDGEDLRQFIRRADWLTANEYESTVIVERSGWSLSRIAKELQAVFITHGSRGSSIYTDARQIQVEAVPAAQVCDPTGCGDAYRAGLLYAICHDLDLLTAARLGALMGALKVAEQGPQNHRFTPPELAEKFQQAFGYSYL